MLSGAWEVIAIRYGTRQFTKHELYLNYTKYAEPDAPQRMDYFFWVLRNEKEVVIVDTGFSAASGAARGREMTVAPATALARLSIDPAAVKKLILTHAHWDHTGNLDLFPNAQILMSQAEFNFIDSDLAMRPLLAGFLDANNNSLILNCSQLGRVTLLNDEDRSIPGILIRALPGHTPGQLAVVIERAQGNIILASDVAHFYEELELDRPFAVVTDLLAMYRSLETLRELAAQPGAVMVPGHDPEVMTRFPTLPDMNFAVCIG